MNDNIVPNEEFEYLNEKQYGEQTENCLTCFYNSCGFCTLKNIKTNWYIENCWSYRDSLTLRPSEYFQDDYDII